MADRLRFAVIGTGGAGLDHLNSLLQCSRVTTVAIAESNPERSKIAADRYKIPRAYLDYRELLEQPDIDAVSIALPNHLHASVAIDALQARKHVLLEKPMAMNFKEGTKIVESAKKMKRTLMVRQNFRFDRHAQVAKTVVDRKDLGDIYHSRCFWLRRSGIPRIGSWFTQKKFAGGGCLIDLGVHVLDTCLNLMGSFDVVSVSASVGARFGPRGLGEYEWGQSEVIASKPFDVEDQAVAFLRLRDHRTVICEVSWAGHQPDNHREHGIDLLGTAASLSLYPARLYRPSPSGFETIDLAPTKLTPGENGFQHFVNSILDGKKPLIGLEESLKVQQILDAIYHSAEQGKEVKIG